MWAMPLNVMLFANEGKKAFVLLKQIWQKLMSGGLRQGKLLPGGMLMSVLPTNHSETTTQHADNFISHLYPRSSLAAHVVLTYCSK